MHFDPSLLTGITFGLQMPRSSDARSWRTRAAQSTVRYLGIEVMTRLNGEANCR
jgi:hypothetical protein